MELYSGWNLVLTVDKISTADFVIDITVLYFVGINN